MIQKEKNKQTNLDKRQICQFHIKSSIFVFYMHTLPVSDTLLYEYDDI